MDNVGLEREEYRQEVKNLKYMLGEERKGVEDMVAKWKERIGRLEEVYRGRGGAEKGGLMGMFG
jgi:hypothetical protein